MTTRTAVYWHQDAEGRLLYIGVTDNPARRLAEHTKMGRWPVARVKVKWYKTREGALAAEREFVAREKPPFNKQNTGRSIHENAVADFVCAVGPKRLAAALGVKRNAIGNAERKGQFPCSWGQIAAIFCYADGLRLPITAFPWKGVPEDDGRCITEIFPLTERLAAEVQAVKEARQ